MIILKLIKFYATQILIVLDNKEIKSYTYAYAQHVPREMVVKNDLVTST